MIWTVTPRTALGPLFLGMTAPEVDRLPAMAGTAERIISADGYEISYRGARLPTCEFFEGKLVRIIAGARVANVSFGNIDVFTAASAMLISELVRHLGPPVLMREQLCFCQDGIALAGFLLREEDRFFDPVRDDGCLRSLSLFAPGKCGYDCTNAEQITLPYAS